MNFDSILSGDTKFSNLRNLCDDNNIEFLNMREQSRNGVIACRFTRGETSIDIRMIESEYFKDLEDTERRLIIIVGAVFEPYKDKDKEEERRPKRANKKGSKPKRVHKKDMFNDISFL